MAETDITTEVIPRTHMLPDGSFLNVAEERFCNEYVRNFNRVDAYIIAYGMEPDEHSYIWYHKKADSLLSVPKINTRIRNLLDSLHLNDEVVDVELAHVISQNSDMSNKVRGIDIYNKVRGRYSATITHKFSNINDDELENRIKGLITSGIEEEGTDGSLLRTSGSFGPSGIEEEGTDGNAGGTETEEEGAGGEEIYSQ